MILAILLIVAPAFAWGRVVSARRSVLSICLFFLLPLILFSSLGEGYGLFHSGKDQIGFHFVKKFSRAEVAAFEIIQAVLSVMVIFSTSWLIKKFGETFHGRHTYLQAFTAVAHGLSPMFLLRLADFSRDLQPWIPWLIGIALSIGALYLGIPLIMQPDPPHAFGLYVMSSLLLFATTGLVQLVTAGYLMGGFKAMEPVVSGLAKLIPL